MSDLTNAGEALALAAVISGAAFVSLHTGDPGETGASNELAATNGYIRKAVAFTGAGSVGDNDDDVVFGPATADKGTVSHFAVWTAESGGTCLFKSALSASRAWPSGTLTIDAGDLTITLD